MLLKRLTEFSIDRPKTVISIMLSITLLFILQLPRISIDTDPENMLAPDQADRVAYDRIKKMFGIHDLMVVGIVDDAGIFRPEALEQVARAIDVMLKIKGVIIEDVISLSTTDNVKSAGGLLDIRAVMHQVPKTTAAVEQLRQDIADNPFLHEKLASHDGTALAVYLPIERKDMSYRIANEISGILDQMLLPAQQYHIAGLPVAEDTFGHEMFVQMAVVAPVAFMVILALVYLLFRQGGFLLPVGLDAMLAVFWTMGLLIGTGQTVHIMSSMIPVFLMPIAILDDVHILSEFFDRYRVLGDKRRALLEGMQPLYRPMLMTSLTSAVGFASLAIADIPPVKVFGLFVAFGILVAWLLSMTMVPAIISLMSDERLKRALPKANHRAPVIDRFLQPMCRLVYTRPRVVLVLAVMILVVGVVGVTRIQVNDNPVKWFQEDHPMRIADTVMNRLFGGTYTAYLVVEGDRAEFIKEPLVVNYMDRLQTHLEADPLVGKTSSIADIVKRVNFVLHDNDPEWQRIPDTAAAVGQFLFLFQSSGDPNDLDNFIDREARNANLWVQMKGGDNQQMQAVEQRLNSFISANVPPEGLSLHWSGLTYINKVWQDLMVVGMLKAILGSFVVVFLLMWVALRSLVLSMLAMVPLTLAIVLSYGLVGWVGKDYDMPIAVCSSLALGLGVDFAIHYILRYRAHYLQTRSEVQTHQYMFGDPGRAIVRNAIVISLGFLPLIASTLTPYFTVGIFFSLLMLFSTLATLFLLPALLHLSGSRILLRGEK